jgi:hypothetical protein
LVVVPFKQLPLITNWLPGTYNASFQKNYVPCFGGNEGGYLALLPGTLGGSPTQYQEMGVYLEGQARSQGEFRAASIITNIMDNPRSTNPGAPVNLFAEQDAPVNNNTSNLGTVTDNTVDKMTKVASPINPVSVPGMYSSTDMKVGQDLNEFLSRPYLLSSGVLSYNDGATPVFQYDLWSDILTLDIYKSKIKGFVGFKATTVFTLQVNATRFQQGRYFLAYIPTVGLAPSKSSDFYRAHTFSFKQWTMLPHVEIDINCDTQVTLRIPYINAEAMAPLQLIMLGANEGGIGVVSLRAYAPVASVISQPTVPYSLYVHFEDVEVQGPTMSQSNFSPRGSKSEKELKPMGPLSTILLSSSEAAGVLSRIPAISSFASTASWALDIVGSAAWAFGLSKPTNINTVVKTQRFNAPYMNNVDGANNLVPLSLQTKYGVEALPGFAGNDIDEMSFDYIKTIFSYQGAISWANSLGTGGNLLALDLSPTIDVTSFTEGSNAIYCYGPLGLLGRQFRNWRGSITMRLKFVKTEFHSGRLLITYCPVDPRSAPTTSNYVNQAYLMKRIIDVRETNEFTVTFPYVQTKNYISIQETMGHMSIDVLDQLQAPATVNSAITMIVEFAAGPDFEVFNPLAINLLPYLPAAPQSNWDPPGCVQESTVIGGGLVKVTDDHARICVGEKIVSLRQLCKWWGFLETNPVVAPSTVASISPFINPSCSYPGATLPPVQGGNLADWIAILSHGFTFSRGSVVISASAMVSGVRSEAYQISMQPVLDTDNTDLFNYTLATTPTIRAQPVNLWYFSMSGIPAFNCPSWSKFLSRRCGDQYESSNLQTRLVSSLPDYRVNVTTPTAGTWTVFRSAGEDFTLGGFVGFGPYYIHP